MDTKQTIVCLREVYITWARYFSSSLLHAGHSNRDPPRCEMAGYVEFCGMNVFLESDA